LCALRCLEDGADESGDLVWTLAELAWSLLFIWGGQALQEGDDGNVRLLEGDAKVDENAGGELKEAGPCPFPHCTPARHSRG
jgi:hypothetical protein